MVILFIETIEFNALNIFELCINLLIYQLSLKITRPTTEHTDAANAK